MSRKLRDAAAALIETSQLNNHDAYVVNADLLEALEDAVQEWVEAGWKPCEHLGEVLEYMGALVKPQSAPTLAEHFAVSRGKMQWALNHLRAQGQVELTRDGWQAV